MVAPPQSLTIVTGLCMTRLAATRSFFGQGGAHAMAYEFECRGIGVLFLHPGEDAVRTPGSRCQFTCELASMSKCTSIGFGPCS